MEGKYLSRKELEKVKRQLDNNINREPNPWANRIIMFPVPKITNKEIEKYILPKYLKK